MNTGSSAGSGTLRYYNRNGEVTDRVLSFGPLETRSLVDVVTTLFGVTTDSAGDLLFTPSTGAFAVTSRTYTTIINDVAMFGTGVPARSLAVSLRPGDVRRIGGIEDAALRRSRPRGRRGSARISRWSTSYNAFRPVSSRTTMTITAITSSA